ncbi:hypothetical protein D9M70_559950 [compost metagenome]
MPQNNRIAVLNLGNRAVLEEGNVAGQTISQSLNQAGWLQEHRAGGVQRLAVERSAEVRREILAIDNLERLAELLQPAPIGVQNLQPFVFDRSLIFADRTQLTVDAVLGNE